MNIYKARFLKNGISEYYCNNKLLFSVLRREWFYYGFGSNCTVYINDIHVLNFYYFNFMGLIYKIQILNQNLDNELKLIKYGFNYKLIIGKKKLSLKLTGNPFRKKIGEIFVDDKSNCIIIMDAVCINIDVDFNFVEDDSDLNFYSLILFSIISVGITDSV